METVYAYARCQVDWECPHCKSLEQHETEQSSPAELTCEACDETSRIEW